MVTVGFDREAKNIKMLLEERLRKEKINDGKIIVDWAKECENYDVLVIHGENFLMCGNFFTIINSDSIKRIYCENKSMVISYGINSLATVSASSITESDEGVEFQLCLQRSIVNLKGETKEPEEFRVKIEKSGITMSEALAYSALCMILF